MRIAFYTLGCKVNQYETQALEQLFTARGHELVPFEGAADAYLINTCTVTAVSDKKSRQIIRRARKTAPDAVIAVDALAARSSKRIASTIQIADTGITPGSGVGNHRKALDRETLGVPVVAVGVPLVVYASTIAADALCALGEGEVEEERIAACVERVVSEKLGEMIVTPREVDALVERMAGVLADGINQALHPRLSRDEIAQMMAQ